MKKEETIAANMGFSKMFSLVVPASDGNFIGRDFCLKAGLRAKIYSPFKREEFLPFAFCPLP
jgi:hypothetical protein